MWLAQRLYPGAYVAVTGIWPWRRALARLWSPTLDFTLPVACGIHPTVFPDNERCIEILPWLTRAWPFIWLALLLLAVVFLAIHFWKRRRFMNGDLQGVVAVFVGLSISAVILFVFSRRSHSRTYRYLLNAAWAVPFMVAYLHGEAPWRWLRRAVAMFAAGLALFNAVAIAHVIRAWSSPGFAVDTVSFYDAGPALAYLEENGLNRVYAGYGLAYRLTYLSGERIVAAQYYNERFHGWPLPYKSAVDNAPGDVAYVLTPRYAVNAERFAKDMKSMGVSMRAIQAGDLTIFHDFRRPDSERGNWLSPSGLRASTSHNPLDAGRLVDGVYEQRWRSHQAQEPGMWVSLEWDDPVGLERIYMYYNFYHRDRARALDVYVLDHGEWRKVLDHVARGMDAPEFDRDALFTGTRFQRIAIPARRAQGVRIAIAEEEPRRDWTIGEIRLWGRETSDDEAAARGGEER